MTSSCKKIHIWPGSISKQVFNKNPADCPIAMTSNTKQAKQLLLPGFPHYIQLCTQKTSCEHLGKLLPNSNIIKFIFA